MKDAHIAAAYPVIHTVPLPTHSSPTTSLQTETALLVADGSCPQIRELLSAAEAPVLWLDGGEHPLQVVSRALQQRREWGKPVDTLHWVSHGSPGELQVGATRISSQTLLASVHDIASWGISTLALWSCKTGADPTFIALWEELSAATVWSSSELLGRLEVGSSNWTLASASATAPPALPITSAILQAWSGQLIANNLLSSTIYDAYESGGTIYAATNGGLSISTNGGNSWTTYTTADGLKDNELSGVYVSGNSIYAAGKGGLSFSRDSGQTWNRVTLGRSGVEYAYDVYAIYDNIYVATNGGLSISTDGGATFSNKTPTDGLGGNIATDVYVIGNTIYVATNGGLSISTDGGATFSNKTTADGLGWNSLNGVYASNGAIYAATGIGLSISTDGGATFSNKTTASNGLAGNAIQGVYESGGTIYAATTNGLSISTDSGNNFTNYTASDGLADNYVLGVYESGGTVYAATRRGLSIAAPPTLATSTPADDSSSVAVGDNLILTFSENISAGSGNILIKKSSDNSPVATIPIGDPKVTISGSTVTINPTADLEAGTGYYLEIAPGVIQGSLGANYLGLTSSTALNFTTASTNNAPTGADKTITVSEDGSHTFAAADFGFSDTDGNNLAAVIITTLPSAGALTLDGTAVAANASIAAADITAGKLVYAPAADANGAGYASFSFQLQDDGGTANGGIDTDASANTISIDVSQVNDAGSFSGDTSGSGAEDGGAISGSLGFSDSADGATAPNYTVATNPTNGTANIDNTSGGWSYTPNANYNGSDSFSVSVTDDDGNSESQSVNLTISQVNDAGSFSGDTSGSGAEDGGAISGSLGFSDSADGASAPNYTVASNPTNGTANIDSTSGGWSYTPNANYNGSDSFSVSVTDDDGNSESQSVNVSISAVDDPALISGDLEGSVQEGATITGTLIATDVEGLTDGTIFSIADGDGPAHGTASIDPETGEWTYTANAGSSGEDSFSVTITDDLYGTTPQTITITVTPAPAPAPASTPAPAAASAPSADTTPIDPAPAGTNIQPTDDDFDGIREVVIAADGTSVDGNRDGIADATQTLVAGLRLINDGAAGSDYGAISVGEGIQLQAVTLTSAETDGTIPVTARGGGTLVTTTPEGITNAFAGVVSFNASGVTPGGTTQATISFPTGLPAGSGNAYLRFNYSTNRFEEFVDANGNPLYSFLDSDNDGTIDSVVLTLTDGDPAWDGDGIANGTVVDPGFLGSGERNFTGGKQSDTLTGNVLANLLNGKGGKDWLYGDLGNDTLKGGDGNDRLHGGEGADQITGGDGKDFYHYTDAAESLNSARDTVWFDKKDRFDFSSFDGDITTEGRQQLSFIGKNAFSGLAGELRVTSSVLEADLNGDAIADFTVVLHGKGLLTSGNFIL